MTVQLPVVHYQYPVFVKGCNAYEGEFWLLSSKAVDMSPVLTALVKDAREDAKLPPYSFVFSDITHKKLGFMCVRLILGYPQPENSFSGETQEKPIQYKRGKRIKRPSPLRFSYAQSDSEEFIETRIVKKTDNDSQPYAVPTIRLREYPMLSGSTCDTMLQCLNQEVIHLKGRDAKEHESWVVPADVADMSALAYWLEEVPLNVVPIVLNFESITHKDLGVQWVKLLRGRYDAFDAILLRPKRKKNLE